MKKIKYRVSIVDFRDDEGLPITVEMAVEPQHQKRFEEFLKENMDDAFIHASGGNIEF